VIVLDASALTAAPLTDQCAYTLRHLAISEWPFQLLQTRCWELRDNFTVHDAAYVAVAERANLALCTLDSKLAAAASSLCSVLIPQ
jgi:predicted nucleic acid-binding protein